jgi:hypothetical protein
MKTQMFGISDKAKPEICFFETSVGVTTKKTALFRRGVLSDGKLIFKYCGIFAQGKNCEARKTAVASERL